MYLQFNLIAFCILLFSSLAITQDIKESPFLIEKNEEVVEKSSAFEIRVKKDENSKEDLLVRMKYEASKVDRKLGLGVTRKDDGSVVIAPYLNYPDFISKKELVFYKPGSDDVLFVKKINTIITITEKEFTDYNLEAFDIILKVYDKDNVYDQTKKVKISKQSNSIKEFNSGFGISRLEKANIPLRGGTVTVYGENAKTDTVSQVEDVLAPVDVNGRYVADIIIPHGIKDLTINVTDKNNTRREIIRNINIKKDKIFFFAMLDATYGQNQFTGPLRVQEARPEEFENKYLHGQVGFYLKGKIQGKYLITAMGNSGEGDAESLFRNLDQKRTDQLLRRLDADKYYPVYGDESTTEETAPTQGKIYLRVQKDKSYVVWGNYETKVLGTDLAQINRSLYGAKLNLESNSQTKYGESKTKVVGFLADPTTFPARDELRGTGGSVYFLSYQDLTIGSEKIRIEVRDRHSGIIKSARSIIYGQDYDINYLQGRIILNESLSSTSGDGDVVTSGTTQTGDPIFLVVDYEVTPTATSLKNNFLVGGNANQWIGDHFKVGVTALKQRIRNGVDNELYGFDLVARITDQSYLKGGYSVTNGESTLTQRSYDGGYGSTNQSAANSSSDPRAISLEGSLDFKDITQKLPGKLNTYYRDQKAGYSALGQSTQQDLNRIGAALLLGDQASGVSGKIEYDKSTSANIESNRYLGQLNYEAQKIFGAIGYGAEKSNVIDEISNVGLRAGLKFGKGHVNKAYLFGQKTIDFKGNTVDSTRYGLGAKYSISKKVSLGGEVSRDVNEELYANAKATYDYNHHSQFYLGYDLSENRNNTGLGYDGIFSQLGGIGSIGASNNTSGTMSVGTKMRFGSSASVYGEDRLYHGQGQDGYTRTYGVDLTPWKNFNLGGNFEKGKVNNLKRTAAGANIGYGTERKHISIAGEYRTDDNLISNQKRKTYVGKFNSKYVASEQFTLLARVNISFSENNQANINDGEFVEGSLGIAFRPKKGDRFNLLGKYTYFYDIPTINQVTVGGSTFFKQKSHVFSVDANLDISKYFTLGGKYGYKFGEQDFLTGAGWLGATSQIAILRGDLHIVHKWDLTLEGRWKNQIESKDNSYGALAGLFYHVNKNVRFGGGYSWSEFSSDLTNLSIDNKGYFINVLSKF